MYCSVCEKNFPEIVSYDACPGCKEMQAALDQVRPGLFKFIQNMIIRSVREEVKSHEQEEHGKTGCGCSPFC